MVFWKFRLTRHPKEHLSIDEDQRGTSNHTLCGLKVTKILGSARTVRELDGSECLKCRDAYLVICGSVPLGVRSV